MKQKMKRKVIRRLSLLITCLLMTSIHLSAQNKTHSSSSTTPMQPEPYRVSISVSPFQGKAGEPLIIPVSITPQTPPIGWFYSILAKPLKKPEGAKVQTTPGNQQIKVTGSKKGTYTLQISVNLIGKSSCGGVDVKEIGSSKATMVLE